MTETNHGIPRSPCHVRVYDDSALVVAFDINMDATSVAEMMFKTWVINVKPDDSPDDTEVGGAYTADGYYATG